jgi:hypothetical protein
LEVFHNNKKIAEAETVLKLTYSLKSFSVKLDYVILQVAMQDTQTHTHMLSLLITEQTNGYYFGT